MCFCSSFRRAMTDTTYRLSFCTSQTGIHTLFAAHSVMQAQQKRWPQGVAVECFLASRQREHFLLGSTNPKASPKSVLWKIRCNTWDVSLFLSIKPKHHPTFPIPNHDELIYWHNLPPCVSCIQDGRGGAGILRAKAFTHIGVATVCCSGTIVWPGLTCLYLYTSLYSCWAKRKVSWMTESHPRTR